MFCVLINIRLSVCPLFYIQKKKREKVKNTKYRKLCHDNGFGFRPFVVSSLGLINGVGADLVRSIALAWATKENLVYSHCVYRIKCHIAFTIMAATTTAITLRNPQDCISDDGVLRRRRRHHRRRV